MTDTEPLPQVTYKFYPIWMEVPPHGIGILARARSRLLRFKGFWFLSLWSVRFLLTGRFAPTREQWFECVRWPGEKIENDSNN